jgi:branched-chain amino acid transport system substrate-binding protein
MTDRRSLAVTIVTAAVFAALLPGCGQRVPATIKIGVAQPLSGPSAARGQDILNGAKLAAADLNAAGYKVAGKPVSIEIVALDDKADKEEAKKVAQALVDQKVTAVIGHLSSDVTEAVIPVYRSANVPQFFTSSAAELTRLGQGNTFRLIANDELQARAIASYAGEALNASKVAILHEDTAFGTPAGQSHDGRAGQAEQEGRVHRGDRQQDHELRAVRGQAEGRAAGGPGRDGARPPASAVVRADECAGLGDVPVIATSVAKTQRLATSAGIKTLYLTSSSAEVDEFAGGKEFVRKFRAAYHSEPVVGGALRLRRRLRAGRHDPAHRVGRPGRAAGQAHGHRRDRAGDDDVAVQRRRRAALRRHQRLPAARRALGPADALRSLVRGGVPAAAHRRLATARQDAPASTDAIVENRRDGSTGFGRWTP